MFYLIPTKRGLGVEFWGSYEDLRKAYELFYAFWELDFEEPNRENLISNICYEIRHAYQGDRLKRVSSHFLPNLAQYFGFQISWVQLLFLIAFVKNKKSESPRNKLLEGFLLQIEYWTEKSLESYDPKIGKLVLPFVGEKIDGGNPYIYYYMRVINADFFSLKGGKRGFKELPELLISGIKGTPSFNAIKKSLNKSAKKFGYSPLEIDLVEDDSVYEIKW